MGQLMPSRNDGRDAAPDDGAVFVDRRVLAFRAAALCELLTAVWQESGAGMRATGIRFSTSRQMLHVAVALSGERLERNMPASELLPMLIAWCLGARIALPSQAEKSVRVTSGGVVLDCVIAHGNLPGYRRKTDRGRVLGEWER